MVSRWASSSSYSRQLSGAVGVVSLASVSITAFSGGTMTPPSDGPPGPRRSRPLSHGPDPADGASHALGPDGHRPRATAPATVTVAGRRARAPGWPSLGRSG